MKKIWKIVGLVALALVALGGILTSVAILTGADLIRINDLFNSSFNVNSFQEYIINTIQNLLGILPMA